MKKGTNLFTITLIGITWFATTKTWAQQDSIRTSRLEAITVTATKFAKSEAETGKVLTIIDEDQIKLSSGKDISQLLNEQVGLFINGANSNPGKDKSIYLRGAKSEYTMILLDGIPLNDPSAIGGGAYDLRLIPLDRVERIEILKGNQSTLYGSNAIAGVINIITKKGSDQPAAGTATLAYGSFGTFKGSVGISGGTKKIDYSTGFSHNATNGISEAHDSSGTGNFDKDGFTQNAFNTNVTFKPSKNFQIQPYFRLADFDGTYDGGPFTDNTKNTFQSTLYNMGITAQHQLKKGSLNFYYGYDKTNRVFVDSAYGFTNTYLYNGRFHHGETFMNYSFNKNIQILSGASFQSWRMLDVASTKLNPSVNLISPYASMFVRNLGGFSAELGGRVNFHTKYGSNFTFSFNPSYLVSDKLKLFFNWSSGFKAPSLQQLFGQYGANENLKPETSQSLEGGFHFFFNQNKGDFRVVAFNRKIEDVIFYTFPEGYINQDKQKDSGFDVEASWAIHKLLRVKSFYSYVDGSQVTAATPKSNNLYRIPKHSLGINLSCQISPKWMVSSNFKSVGKRSDLFFNGETFANETVALKTFQLLDIYTEHNFSKNKLKIFLDAKNILNQKYYEVYGYSVLQANVNAGICIAL